MKKTKILLVLAIAMLAMFAMSACGLVAQGIEKVEFEVMPKNYFVAEDFAGINVKFNATIAGSVYTVDYTADANVENEKVEIAGANFSANVTVKGYPTEMKMGEYTLNVTVEGVSAEYAFRLCTEVAATADEENKIVTLETAATNGGYYILKEDITTASSFRFAKAIVIYGNNNALTFRGEKRPFIVGGVDGSRVNGGLFEFNNLVIRNESTTANGAGIRVQYIDDAIININACEVSAENSGYAINVSRASNLVVNISNGTTARAWAALNTYSVDSVYNIDNVEFFGENYNPGESFGTIVVSGDALYKHQTPNWEIGTYGAGNVVNISNCVLSTYAVEGADQSVIDLQYCASNNVVNVENCTNENGEKLVMRYGLVSMADDEAASDRNYNCDCRIPEELYNKLYFDGVLYTAKNTDLII